MTDQAIADEVLSRAHEALEAQDWHEAIRLWEFIHEHIDPDNATCMEHIRVARSHL